MPEGGRERLQKMAEMGLNIMVEQTFCTPGLDNCPEGKGCYDKEGCANCPGFQFRWEMENQLVDDAINRMAEQLRAWRAVCDA